MTWIAPLEVKLRACDEQREDVSVGLKENLTELQGYFGGTGGNCWTGFSRRWFQPVHWRFHLSACGSVGWWETSAAPPCVYTSVPAAPRSSAASLIYVHSELLSRTRISTRKFFVFWWTVIHTDTYVCVYICTLPVRSSDSCSHVMFFLNHCWFLLFNYLVKSSNVRALCI